MISIGLNSFLSALILGSLVMLAFIKITNPLQVNKKGNFLFGIFLFLWSTYWLDEFIPITNAAETSPYFSIFVRLIQFMTPIVFYFSILYFTHPTYKIRKADIRYLILPAVFLTVLLIAHFSNPAGTRFLQVIMVSLVLAQALFYAIASYLKIRKHQKNLLYFSSYTHKIDLNWLEYIIFLVLLLAISISLYNLFSDASSLNAPINLIFLATIYLIAYYSLKQKEIFPGDEKQRDQMISISETETGHQEKKKILPDRELADLKTQLSALMDQEQPYLDSELNLIKLAEQLGTTPHKLSHLINTGFQENFFRFVNRYRVEKAKELLLKKNTGGLSILGIAYESGFNSKTSFYTTFKKMTGQTPSEFRKSSSSL